MIKRGYKAREKAGLDRSRRRLVSDEVREQRAVRMEETNARLAFNVIEDASSFEQTVEAEPAFEPDTSGITRAGDMVTVTDETDADADAETDDGEVDETDADETKTRKTRAKK